MEAVLDTNVLIYDTFEDSIHHREAARLIDTLRKWVIPLIVVYEYVWFMKGMGVSVETVLRKVEEYTEPKRSLIIWESMDILRKALTRLLREDLSLSRFNDKVILTVAKEMELPLVTFDLKLRSQAEKIGVTVYP